MIFLTTGEKIRNLRKKFNMRQQELEDRNITRAFISMIETGKRGLSKETARHIADKINNKALKLGSNLKIDEAYLLRTPNEDAEVYCLEKLYNNPTPDEIDVIIEVSKKYNLIKVEAQAYKTIGDNDYASGNYRKAFINYIISLDLFKDTEDKNILPYLYNRLGVCKVKQLEYIEAISFLGRANHYSKLYNDEVTYKYCLYNLSKAYIKLRKYDEALAFIEKYLLLFDKKDEYKYRIHANILKANCYRYKGNNERAISILTTLLDEFKDDENEFLWYVLDSISSIYLEQNNIESSLSFLERAERAAENKNNKNLAYTYMQEACIYLKQKKYDEALMLANKGLKLTEYNDTEGLANGYNVLADIYTNLRDFQNLKTIYTKLLDIFKNNERYKDKTIKIYNKLALLYLDQNDIEMCKKYLNMVS